MTEYSQTRTGHSNAGELAGLDPQTRTQALVARQVLQALDREDHDLPMETVYALQRARQIALARRQSPAWQWLKPLTAGVPALAVLMLALQLPVSVPLRLADTPPANAPAAPAGLLSEEELALLNSDADPELLREMDLLIWMSEQERLAGN